MALFAPPNFTVSSTMLVFARSKVQTLTVWSFFQNEYHSTS